MPDLNFTCLVSYKVGNFENRTTISGIFSQFTAAHAQKWPEFHFTQIFYPKFETPMGCFLFDYKFWWHLLLDLCMFWAKTAFIMKNFRNLGASRGGSDHFWRDSQKAHPWLISCILSHYARRSVPAFFSVGD